MGAGRDIWVFLFVAGLVLLNWPFLGIFDKGLPYYLFITWGVLIAASAGAVAALGRGRRGKG